MILVQLLQCSTTHLCSCMHLSDVLVSLLAHVGVHVHGHSVDEVPHRSQLAKPRILEAAKPCAVQNLVSGELFLRFSTCVYLAILLPRTHLRTEPKSLGEARGKEQGLLHVLSEHQIKLSCDPVVCCRALSYGVASQPIN